MKRLWYMATPYSRYDDGIEEAFREAAAQAAMLIQAGVLVFSPISHTHPIAIYGEMDPYDHSVWIPQDEEIMSRCDGLIVCRMRGWESSKGVFYEINHFHKAGKPIVYMDVDQVPKEVLSA